jgi:hypothetical protein
MTSRGWSVLVLVFFPQCSKVLHLEILGAWSECLFQMERFLRTVMSSIFQYFWCRSRILHMALLLGLYPMLNLECGWNTENMIEMWIGSEKASHALDQAQEYSTIYLNDGSFYQLSSVECTQLGLSHKHQYSWRLHCLLNHNCIVSLLPSPKSCYQSLYI